ncbi:MAG: hypothetical protein Kow0075_03230 [Salibacteraceae bacterium]
MRKFFFLLFILSIVVTDQSLAQRWKRYRHEAFGGIGATGFLGEVGGGNGPARDLFLDLDGKASRYCITGGYRFRVNELFSARSTLVFGRLYGSDELAGDVWRRSRNLHFRSPILELAVAGELYFIPEKANSRYRVRGIKGILGSSLSAYIFTGIAGFWFNPRAQFVGNAKYPGDNKWYSLQPLGTEGQGLSGQKKYSRISFAIPLGAGAKYTISRTVSLGLEFGFRYAFTDYIDDVSTVYYDEAKLLAERGPAAAYFSNPAKPLKDSEGRPVLAGGPMPAGEQRGDPTTKDTYMFAVLTMNYKFISKKTNRPKF